MNLYIARDGESLGPYSDGQVREFLRTEIFAFEDLGCPEGKQNWQPLRHYFTPMVERTFYDHAGIRVTNARFIVAGETYAVRNITSVRGDTWKPAKFIPVLMMVLGAVFGVFVVVPQAWVLGVVGLALFGLGYFERRRQKARYLVILTTNAGQVQALVDPDEGKVRSIIQAVNEAMVAHA